MWNFIYKTFGGLTVSYYFRQFAFGLMIPYSFSIIFEQSTNALNITVMPMWLIVINTILYPYARLVYENVVGFIFGDNIFIIGGLFLLIMTIITMTLCWYYASVIAPVGLIYLYIYHTDQEEQCNAKTEHNT